MAYERVNWLNKGETGAKAINKTNLNQMDKGIYDLQNVELIAVTGTVPTECTKGEKYFNNLDNLIYTATDTNKWGETGEEPLRGILYVVISSQTSYYYDGTTLISIGGGSGSGDSLPVGSIVEYDGDVIPDGYEEVNDETEYTITARSGFALSIIMCKKVGDFLIIKGSATKEGGTFSANTAHNVGTVPEEIQTLLINAYGSKWDNPIDAIGVYNENQSVVASCCINGSYLTVNTNQSNTTKIIFMGCIYVGV